MGYNGKQAVYIDLGLMLYDGNITTGGSPVYLPDEVLEWKGLKPGDLKDNVHANIFIDVFGLGQTLFELACGRHLYDAIRKSKTLTAVFSGGLNSLTPENKFNACYVCKDENYQEKHCSNERRFFVDFVDHFMISEY